jgi:hypothetical protein
MRPAEKGKVVSGLARIPPSRRRGHSGDPAQTVDFPPWHSAHDHPAGDVMTLGNMRSLFVSCWLCHHRAVLSADRWPDEIPVPAFGPRMVCTSVGIVGADAQGCGRKEAARSIAHVVARYLSDAHIGRTAGGGRRVPVWAGHVAGTP